MKKLSQLFLIMLFMYLLCSSVVAKEIHIQEPLVIYFGSAVTTQEDEGGAPLPTPQAEGPYTPDSEYKTLIRTPDYIAEDPSVHVTKVSSSNPSIVEINEYQTIIPTQEYGKATVSVEYSNGDIISRDVVIKEISLYMYIEYPEFPSRNMWTNSGFFWGIPGQTYQYMLEERTYDEKGKLISRKDVTNTYLFKSRDYVNSTPGRVTFLKNCPTSKDNPYHYYEKIPIPNEDLYIQQYVYLDARCWPLTYYKDSLFLSTTFDGNPPRDIRITLTASGGGFEMFKKDTNEEVMMMEGDYFFGRMIREKIQWKASDPSMIRFTKIDGYTCEDDWSTYSTAHADYLKEGKVDITISYDGVELLTETFTIESYMVKASGSNPSSGSNSNSESNSSGENKPRSKTPKTTPAKVKEPITISKTPSSVKAKTKKNKVTVSWKKIKKNKAGKKLLKQIKSIQVQYSTDKAFKQNVKTKTVGKKKTKVTLKLQKKTTYYIRVRYKGANGFSKWSKVKRVKTKK